MIVGLDFDGTITRAPDVWRNFVNECLAKNHQVYIVTMRHESEKHLILNNYSEMVQVIYTGRLAKRPFVEKLGIKIDVWIDDNPRAVEENAEQIWPIDDLEDERNDYNGKVVYVDAKKGWAVLIEDRIVANEFVIKSDISQANLLSKLHYLQTQNRSRFDKLYVSCRDPHDKFVDWTAIVSLTGFRNNKYYVYCPIKEDFKLAG